MTAATITRIQIDGLWVTKRCQDDYQAATDQQRNIRAMVPGARLATRTGGSTISRQTAIALEARGLVVIRSRGARGAVKYVQLTGEGARVLAEHEAGGGS